MFTFSLSAVGRFFFGCEEFSSTTFSPSNSSNSRSNHVQKIRNQFSSNQCIFMCCVLFLCWFNRETRTIHLAEPTLDQEEQTVIITPIQMEATIMQMTMAPPTTTMDLVLPPTRLPLDQATNPPLVHLHLEDQKVGNSCVNVYFVH